MDAPLYRDRRNAGEVLAARLGDYRGRPGLIVLALPRGGVEVGFEVARALQAPLDVFVVRKLGYPGHEEYAMGAIASGGVRVMNELPGPRVDERDLQRVVARERAELQRREALYRGGRKPLDLHDRCVILVDDGLATGATMRAAAVAVRRQQPARLCIAVPVGATDSCESMKAVADEVVCAATPADFTAVGLWYQHFPQASDAEVQQLLAAGAALPA